VLFEIPTDRNSINSVELVLQQAVHRIHLPYLLWSLLPLYRLFSIIFDPCWIPTYLIVLFFKLHVIGKWKVSTQVMVSLFAMLNNSERFWRWCVTPITLCVRTLFIMWYTEQTASLCIPSSVRWDLISATEDKYSSVARGCVVCCKRPQVYPTKKQ